ncbi:MAG: SagB/ThcOx family dehydrogenase [bacterium]|nr:SagB/ThcOx family dehydrogenase [bacterium]
MSEIIKKIIALKNTERKILVGDIMENEKGLKEAFCKMLQKAGEPLQEEFYKSLPQGWDGFIKEEVSKAGTLAPEKEQKALQEISQQIDGIGARMEKMEQNTAKAKKQTLKFRETMKAGFIKLEKVVSDQTKGIERWPLQKECPKDAEIIELPKPDKSVVKKNDIFDCIGDRKSRRKFTDEPLSLAELSYLLWATQGIKKVVGDGKISIRNVPSGGAMHPFETYLAVNNVTGLKKGMYRYQPVDHKIVKLFTPSSMPKKLAKAALDQDFVGNCAVTFIWSAVPYKTEWRYSLEAKKIILQDSGHLCQNLYLACESINCGTCAIGAYHQRLFDKLCQLDGKDEFVIYVAPVGRVAVEAGAS